MKKLTIKDWFLFGEWHGLYSFHSCYYDGVINTTRDWLGYGLSQFVVEQESGIYRAYLSRSEWTNIGKKYSVEVIDQPQKLEEVLQEIRTLSNDLIKFSRKLKGTSVEKLNKAELRKLLMDCHKKLHPVWAVGMVPNVLELENSFLSDYLKSWLSEQGIPKKKQLAIFQALITPRELSAGQKEERAMLELAGKKDPIKELKSHHRLYSWLHFGWTGPSLNLEYFVAVHQGLHNQGTATKQLDVILKKDAKLVKDKEQFIKSLKITGKHLTLFRLLEENLFIKALRMDAIYMCYEACQPLLKKIASNYHLSLNQVYSLYFDDLIAGMQKNSFDVDFINFQSKYSVKYFDGSETHSLVGGDAKKIAMAVKETLPKVKTVDEIVGESAYPGKVKGKVSIINLASEMGKFNDGDILVSNVTDPSLLPVMKKAKAFVTNMGGLTCHAAIVSRELEIPCVVGTRIATQIFKDGDLVEVDATKGIVRKI